ncbi:hypothetical protein ACQ4PT_018049 [Festuca glaucescens]
MLQCDVNHLLCSSCRGVHGEACGRPVAHSTLAESFAAAAFVPCDYGCHPGYVVYHGAADHLRACLHAPCGCPELCGFSASPQKLLEHISDHSRTILVVRYGQPRAISLPLSRRWQVLVGEEDNADWHRNVFLVSLNERGEEVEVSLVCVRADGGVPPQFSCKIDVVHSEDGTRQTLESPAMKSSSLSNGTPAAGEVKWLKVMKEYLSGEIVPLTVRIDKLAQPPPFSPKPPPFSPTRPFSPMSPPFSPTRPFSPKPSPKRHCPMSPSVAFPPPSAAEGKAYKRTRKGT